MKYIALPIRKEIYDLAKEELKKDLDDLFTSILGNMIESKIILTDINGLPLSFGFFGESIPYVGYKFLFNDGKGIDDDSLEKLAYPCLLKLRNKYGDWRLYYESF
jgi:hypothetical protein